MLPSADAVPGPTEPMLPCPLRIVLVETSHPGNVGSVARAMKTMGFADLVLVNPKLPDVAAHPDAVSLASGAQDVLHGARVVDSLVEALQGCTLVGAVTARLREFSPPVLLPQQFAAHLQAMPAAGDLQGSSGTINPGERQPLKIVIDKVIG